MNSRTQDTFLLELGSRVVGDMLGENGPAAWGVITKRCTLASPRPVKRKSTSKITLWPTPKGLKQVWHAGIGAYFTVERTSRKGNLVCTRSYGVKKGQRKVFRPREVEECGIVDLSTKDKTKTVPRYEGKGWRVVSNQHAEQHTGH
jgi:hypothetical protein